MCTSWWKKIERFCALNIAVNGLIEIYIVHSGESLPWFNGKILKVLKSIIFPCTLDWQG